MPSKVRACVVRVGGTNCDIETKRAFDDLGDSEADILRINQLRNGKSLQDYDCLVIPGGFSYGDHIRAGTVFANRMKTDMEGELESFIDDGGSVFGICNGFQVLVEMGLLPGLGESKEFPTAALAINESAKYECRWVHLRNENRGKCAFTGEVERGRTLFMPVAHKEGRFMVDKKREKEILKDLYDNDQVVLRYSDEDGNPAEGRYPENPNGSLDDIAGICDPSGRVFGLMPHPERAYYGLQLPDWTQREVVPEYGSGRLLFESIVECLK